MKSSERARDLSLAEAATSIIFVATKVLCVCRNKTRLSSRQKYASRDKRFVATNTCLSQQRFVATKMILVAAPGNDRDYQQPIEHGTRNQQRGHEMIEQQTRGEHGVIKTAERT